MFMKKSVLILGFLFLLIQWGTAQSIDDKELQSLIGVVKMLRTSDEATFNKASQILLTADIKWTSMNELGIKQKTECLPVDKVPGFKLNRILSKAEGNRKYVYTHGDMLNGEDERYNYSLYERSVKAGMEVTYSLKGREGAQVFVLIPFKGENAQLSGYITLDGGQQIVFETEKQDVGLLVAYCKSSILTRDKKFSITIKNGSQENQSFVIINHNTRK